ncbi:MAG: hypothetical protein WAL63_17695 [Solirubrobacteraceae bacterium]
MLTRADIAAGARRLSDDGYALRLVSNRAVLERLNLAPFGLPLTTADLLAAPGADWSVDDLMRVYNVLNATAFGDKGIPLQNWVMIDLGLLPSAFVLITLPVARAAAAMAGDGDRPPGHGRARRVLSAVLDEAARLAYAGPIPVAGYCAAPTPTPGSWVGWSLCSAIPGIGTTAKGLGLEVYRARTLTGIAQFSDLGLRVHRKFGRMEVLRAVLDLHPVAHTMVYRTDVYESDAETTPTMWMDCRDLAAQREMQARLDAGTSRFYVLSPGLVDDRVPILECN